MPAQIRALILAVIGFAGCVYFVAEFLQKQPTFEELIEAEGAIQLDMSEEHPTFSLPDSSATYKYLYWCPRADELDSLIQQGRDLTIWYDRKMKRVWQIEQHGVVVMPYSEVHAVISKAGRQVWILAVGSLAVGIFGSVWLYRLRKGY